MNTHSFDSNADCVKCGTNREFLLHEQEKGFDIECLGRDPFGFGEDFLHYVADAGPDAGSDRADTILDIRETAYEQDLLDVATTEPVSDARNHRMMVEAHDGGSDSVDWGDLDAQLASETTVPVCRAIYARMAMQRRFR